LDLAEYLHKELKAQKDALADSLAHGTAKDFPHYREMVGEIKGINRALRLIEETPRE
jgi:hypothetical protein